LASVTFEVVVSYVVRPQRGTPGHEPSLAGGRFREMQLHLWVDSSPTQPDEAVGRQPTIAEVNHPNSMLLRRRVVHVGLAPASAS
jgi:hypothetical protein